MYTVQAKAEKEVSDDGWRKEKFVSAESENLDRLLYSVDLAIRRQGRVMEYELDRVSSGSQSSISTSNPCCRFSACWRGQGCVPPTRLCWSSSAAERSSWIWTGGVGDRLPRSVLV